MIVLMKSRTHMESSGWIWGQEEDFPQETTTRNALALLMENTCFLSDIFLRFPDLLHAKFHENNEWAALYKWSLTFVVESQLTDTSTNKLLNLASQEMGLTEKDPDYHNPYKQPKIKQKRFEDPPPPKKKEKKKIKKGPRLSKNEL